MSRAHVSAFTGCRTLNDLLDSPRVKPKIKNYIRLLDVQERSISRPEVEEFRERIATALSSSDSIKCVDQHLDAADGSQL